MSKALKDKAAKAAAKQGFSSLQETVRIFLNQLADQDLSVRFEAPPVKLSAKAARRYEKMIEDMESGKTPVYSAKSVKDLMDQLHGNTPKVRTQLP